MTFLGRLPITTERRTALDLLRSMPWEEARELWAWLVTRQQLSLDDLMAELKTGAGRTGTAQLRRLATASRTGSLSPAEDRLHRLLAAARITGWTANARVQVGRRTVVVDVLFEAARVVIEVDGYRTHSSREAFQRDRSRQNDLVSAGYLVLRFTWEDLTRRPAVVVANPSGRRRESRWQVTHLGGSLANGNRRAARRPALSRCCSVRPSPSGWRCWSTYRQHRLGQLGVDPDLGLDRLLDRVVELPSAPRRTPRSRRPPTPSGSP